jgi:DNA polymerase-1
MKLTQRVTDIDQLREHMDKICSEGIVFGFDIETGYDGDDRDKAATTPELMKVVGISYAMNTDEGFYVPLAHDLERNEDLATVAEVMKPALQSGLGVAHNAKFEIRCLAQPQPRGFGYHCRVFSDTQIEAYVLQEWQSFALKSLVYDVFAYEQATYASLFPGAKPAELRRSRFNHLPVSPAVISYAVDDSIWCLALHLRHHPLVADTAVYKLEMQVLDVVVAMEEVGLYYDWDYLRAGAEGCLEFIDQLEIELVDELSEMVFGVGMEGGVDGVPSRIEVNLASPAQLSDVLYNKLGLPVTMRSKKTDKPSTSADALTPLAKDYPAVQKILWWKELKKLHGTYLNKYERAYSGAADGRTHPNTMQAVVVSGRFAVSDPPYQQTPKKYRYELDSGAHWEFEFRPSIRPQEGNYFLYFDYSQVELRVVAGLAKEQALIDAFASGTDVHRVTASLMLNVPFDEVTGDQRDIGKTMNFALVYGMSTKMLAQRLAVTQERAEELYQAYFDTYGSIKVWRQRVIEEASAKGYTVSWLGRKHKIWEFESNDRWVFEKGERLAGNAPVQGGAADYMKVAMVRQHKKLAEAGLLADVRLVANVHDSLTWEVTDAIDPFDMMRLLNPAVSFPLPGFPPITADWAVGLDWGNLHEISLVEAEEHVAERWSVYDIINDIPQTLSPEPLPAPESPAVVSEPLPFQPDPAAQYDEPSEGSESLGTKRMVVTLQAMPTKAQWSSFTEWLATNAGECEVHVVTPKGSVDLPQRVSERANTASVIHFGNTGRVEWEVFEDTKDLLVSGLGL